MDFKLDGQWIKNGRMIEHLNPKAIIERKAFPRVEAALADTRVVLISGPRRAGKTALARMFSDKDRPYVTLDDAGTLNAAKTDARS